MKSLITYFRDSYHELAHQVTWTRFNEAQRLTVVVALFSIIFSLAIWGIDTVFQRAMDFYFDLI